MNNKLKKYLSLLLAIVMIAAINSAVFTAFADDLVCIDSSNFSDAVFCSVLKKYYDKDNDGYLSAEERNVSLMAISGMLEENQKIESLDGIEYFSSSLEILRCGDIGLNELDVSDLTNLTALTCPGNELTSLDVSSNTLLVTLDCSDNNISTLTLGDITAVQYLYCQANSIGSLSFSKLKSLKELCCDQNEFNYIDLSNNTLLEYFSCSYNNLSSLDLSHNTLLTGLSNINFGNQTTNAAAKSYESTIIIPYSVDNYGRVVSTSLDVNDSPGFLEGNFYASDVKDIDNGITYYYSVGLSDCEDMEVTVSVSRSFYQVDFYTDSDLTSLLSRTFVQSGESAAAPEITEYPQCKALDAWSEDLTDIQSDVSVYPVWADSHSYALTDFDGVCAVISCGECGESYTVKFIDCVNSFTGDDNYCEYIDVVNDGVINAKDFAQLEKMF